MNLDKLDKIVLTVDQTETIAKWNLDNPQADRGFPLTEGVLIVKGIEAPFDSKMTSDMGAYFKLNEDTGSMEIRMYEMGEPTTPLVTVILDDEFYNTGKLKVSSRYKRLTDEYLQNVARTNVMMLLDTFVYMLNAREQVVSSRITKQISKPVKNKKKSSTNRNRVAKITTKTYSIDFDRVEPEEKRQYTRRTDGWGVRGFWRTYKKTGKKIWVPGYPKGDHRKIEPKEYRM